MTVDRKKWIKRAIFAGLILGACCPLLPERYQTVCRAIADILGGIK